MKNVSEKIFNEGMQQGKETVAKELLAQNILSLKQIAEVTGISMERLVELQNDKT